MAKKKNNTIYYVVAVVVIILIAVFMMKKPAEEPPAVEPTPEPEPVPEPETPTLPEPEVPTDYKGEVEMVSQMACVDGVASGRITNTDNVAWVYGKDVKVLLRGLVIHDPGCEKMELEPGESADCTTLNGPFQVVEGLNEITVRSKNKEVIATVTC